MREINLTLENIVFVELPRRGYAVTVGRYGEDRFVVEEEKVCYRSSATLRTLYAWEFRTYKDIKDNFPKYV